MTELGLRIIARARLGLIQRAQEVRKMSLIKKVYWEYLKANWWIFLLFGMGLVLGEFLWGNFSK